MVVAVTVVKPESAAVLAAGTDVAVIQLIVAQNNKISAQTKSKTDNPLLFFFVCNV